jgi:hypothetical protein
MYCFSHESPPDAFRSQTSARHHPFPWMETFMLQYNLWKKLTVQSEAICEYIWTCGRCKLRNAYLSKHLELIDVEAKFWTRKTAQQGRKRSEWRLSDGWIAHFHDTSFIWSFVITTQNICLSHFFQEQAIYRPI